MKEWIKKQLIKLYEAQTLDISSTEPTIRERNGDIYFASPAGVIIYRKSRSRSMAEYTKFRDKYVNGFQILTKMEEVDDKEYFKFYAKMRKEKGVSYKANIRTRVVGVYKCAL